MVLRTKILALIVGIGVASSVTVSTAAIQSDSDSKTASRPSAKASRLEGEVIDLVVTQRGLPIRDGSFDDPARYCPRERIQVSWTPPEGKYLYGAHIEPLGPAPGPETAGVNGIVTCKSSTYAYMGFEALRTFEGWDIVPVPDFAGDDDPVANLPDPPDDSPDPKLTPRATPPPAKSKPTAGKPGLPSPVAGNFSKAIEPYAAYDPQSTCSPSAKPGMLAFRSLVLSRYKGTGSLGISRNCSAGGRSEHKEGRAWDWRVNVNRSAERASAQNLMDWLFASDEFGNGHAMARRLGIMYIVWNRHIWGSYRASAGWRPYNGVSPHTDHVHFSFARAGGAGKTSFWTGVPASLPGAAYASSSSGSGGGSSRSAQRSATRTRAPRGSPGSTPSPDDAHHEPRVKPSWSQMPRPSWSPWPQPTWTRPAWPKRDHRRPPQAEPSADPTPEADQSEEPEPTPSVTASIDADSYGPWRARRTKRAKDSRRWESSDNDSSRSWRTHRPELRSSFTQKPEQRSFSKRSRRAHRRTTG